METFVLLAGEGGKDRMLMINQIFHISGSINKRNETEFFNFIVVGDSKTDTFDLVVSLWLTGTRRRQDGQNNREGGKTR